MLKRYPPLKNEVLQAWDSADDLLIEHMTEALAKTANENPRILILNDAFGALSCALQNQSITSYTDSYVSHKAIEINSSGKVKTVHVLDDLSGIYDWILIKIPGNQSFFEDQLCRLTAHLNKNSKIVCGAKVKHLAKSSFDLLNRIIGETITSLAKKKARLIFADFTRSLTLSPYPIQVSMQKAVFSLNHSFTHHSNLFSREKLDIGTRFFLEHIPLGEFHSILDLGCANGIIGIRAKQLNPRAKIIFTDDSYHAILSARENYEIYCKDDSAQFQWTNGYEDGRPDSIDLVLCNPPFHQQKTTGDFIAWQMFTDSFCALKPGGLLRVIGNNHLAYGAKLKKIFGNCKKLASNSKFSVFDATK